MSVFNKADILIPKNIDFSKWSVVACDQYTSEPKYWEAVEKEVSTSPSTLKIIFPEVYLTRGDGDERIKKINKTMEDYLKADIFRELSSSLVLTERTQRNGEVLYGIVGSIDLEAYSYEKGSSSPIRASEQTVLERIPPRVKIRENAPLELPHILLLIDDEKNTVIEPLLEKKDTFEKIYDFDCMMNSGHLTGYVINDTDFVFESLQSLCDVSEFQRKYNTDEKDMLLFAVGDGNHSLATAKACWEALKPTLTEEEKKTHPARFALVEIVNIHEKALQFEPIHRVVFGVDPERMLDAFFKFYSESSFENNGGKYIKFMYGEKSGDLYVKNSGSNLSVGALQNFIDAYLAENDGSVDYIHGADVAEKLSKEENNIAFLLPPMKKSELFETIIKDGVLPRKTFSMGEAEDKRFYLECKKIR